jgi:hypothetical protein
MCYNKDNERQKGVIKMANTEKQRKELLIALKGIIELNEDLELLEWNEEDELEWGFLCYYKEETGEEISFRIDDDEEHFIKMFIDGVLEPLPTIEKGVDKND